MPRAHPALAGRLGLGLLIWACWSPAWPQRARAQQTPSVAPATASGVGATAQERSRRRRQQVVARVLSAVERDLQRGQHAGALRRLRSSLQTDPREAAWLLRYAQLVVPLASPRAVTSPALTEGASDLLRWLMRRDALPGDPDAPLDLAREHALALHAAVAEAVLARYPEALTRVTSTAQLQDALAVLCLRQIAALAVTRETLPVAEQALALARQYLPQDLTLGTELGHVLLARGATEQAIPLFAERYAVSPSLLEARRDLAYALSAAGRAGEALALLTPVADACRVEPGCSLEAARIALEAGRPSEAIAFAEQLLAREPDDLDALFVAADAHTRTEQLDAARAAYERVLRVRPESVRAKQALEQLRVAR
jgi:tetratricopeptide (TPR) repeat protein